MLHRLQYFHRCSDPGALGLDLAPVQTSDFINTHLAWILLVLLTEAEPLSSTDSSSTDSSAATLKDAESAHLLCEEAVGGLKMT